MKFVDVKNDIAFHKIFGDSSKTITLVSFLNAVLELEGTKRVARVQIENPYQFPTVLGGKVSIIDITATDQQGRKFIVEMQVADKTGFIKRAQYYTARDYSMQINSGNKYPQLRPTHFIAILEFNLTPSGYYFSRHKTLNEETGEHLLKDMQYFFIELQKFTKTLSELDSAIDKWTFFIKNAENLDLVPDNVDDEGLKTAYYLAEKHAWKPAELKAYEDAKIRITDGEMEIDFALKKGRQEERAKAEAEKEQIILKMHKAGLTIETIADFVSKSHEQVQQIIAQHADKK